ncbi:hypothetical protein [Actinocorallia aurea]
MTSYVRKVRAGQKPMYAKVSVLGASLVSVARGRCGDLSHVLKLLPGYLEAADGVVARESSQLLMLRSMNVPVCTVAGFRRGVLFTHAVAGPTLPTLFAEAPNRSGELLAKLAQELPRIEKPSYRSPVMRSAIPERDIPTIFERKFERGHGREYLDATGFGPGLTPVVERLSALRGVLDDVPRKLQYGDLKPEHVLFPKGPSKRLVLVDPGLTEAHPSSDLARLASRVALLVMAGRLPAEARAAVTDDLVEHLHVFGPGEVDGGLRDLVLLWLMDAVNILTTYCTAPEGLPIGQHAFEVRKAAESVAAFLEEASQALVSKRRSADLFGAVVAALDRGTRL